MNARGLHPHAREPAADASGRAARRRRPQRQRAAGRAHARHQRRLRLRRPQPAGRQGHRAARRSPTTASASPPPCGTLWPASPTCSSSAAAWAPRTTTSPPSASPRRSAWRSPRTRDALALVEERVRVVAGAPPPRLRETFASRGARRSCRPAPLPCRRPASRPASPRARAARASTPIPACPTSSSQMWLDDRRGARARGLLPGRRRARRARLRRRRAAGRPAPRRAAARPARARHQRRRGRGHVVRIRHRRDAGRADAGRRARRGAGGRRARVLRPTAAPSTSSSPTSSAGRGRTVAVAESCTGGLLGARITARPGSSDYFLGGVISYADRVKMDLLGVPPGMLAQYGAVSEEVAGAMAEGARAAPRADYALSVTGVAGPDGGTAEKPVGLVYLGCAGPAGHARPRGLVPGRPRQRCATFSRDRRAAPAARGARARERAAQADRSGCGSSSPATCREDVERAVAEWQRDRARRPTRTCASRRTLHLTLGFLGSVDAARVPDLERVLERHRVDARRSAASRTRSSCRSTAATGRRAGARRPGRRAAAPAGGGLGGARRRRPLRAREAALAAARHGGPIPPSRSPIFPAKRELRRVWCRPDGPV